MQVTDEIIKKYAKKVVIVIEILYYHTNTNGLVFHADST